LWDALRSFFENKKLTSSTRQSLLDRGKQYCISIDALEDYGLLNDEADDIKFLKYAYLIINP